MHLFPSARRTVITVLCTAAVASLLFGERALAKAVISEVDWAGSDLSTSDEWVEIAGIDDPVTPMAGWTLTSVNSGGVETTIFTFPAGAQISVDQVVIVSHFGAAQSRLLADPAFTATSVTLPNSKLLLRLRDQNGQVMDTVDDGVGDPMAGNNPTPKASMERIDLTKPGTDASNWISATIAQGLDSGAAMTATPGFPVTIPPFHNFSSSSSASSSITSSSSSPSAHLPISSSSSSPTSTTSSSSASCLFDPYIAIQSGAATGEEKVTLNIQMLQRYGSLGSAVCSVDFGDGTVSPSCNPASHTYDRVGSYTIRADITNLCGGGAPLQRTLTVEVTAKATTPVPGALTPSAASDPSAGGEDPVTDRLPVAAPGSPPFILSAVMPNPAGKDAGGEWVEITNISRQTATLEGWILRLPHAKKSTYVFGGIGFSPQETKRFLADELGMTFGNDEGELSLLRPGQIAVSSLAWKSAKDGVAVRLQRTFSGTMSARVEHVVDGDTIDVSVSGLVSAGIGATERVRFIGIDAPELHAKDPQQRMLAKRAADSLRQLLEGTTVTLTPGTDARDAYGRLLAYVSTEQGDSVQETLLREGMVSVYLRYAFGKEAEFLTYQREAQDANAGMWGIVGAEGSPLLSSLVPVRVSGSSSVGSVSGLIPESGDFEKTLSITHLSSSASSASKSSKAKKSSSSAKKKTTAKKKSSSSKKSAAPPPSYAADLLALGDLVENPDEVSAEEFIDDEEGDQQMSLLYPAVDNREEPAGFPVVWLTAGLIGMASISGIIGWLLGRKRK